MYAFGVVAWEISTRKFPFKVLIILVMIFHSREEVHAVVGDAVTYFSKYAESRHLCASVSMCLCLYVCIYLCVCVYECLCLHPFFGVSVCLFVRACMCTCVSVSMYLCLRVCI